jgi:hypothetical protein
MPRFAICCLTLLLSLLTACHGGKNAATTTVEIEVPPAGVLVGEPLKWRTLASFPADTEEEKPTPGIVVGEFTKDKLDDILLIDWLGQTEIIQPSGKRTPVKGEIWPAIFSFTAWDYNRDGCCELVPSNYGLIWVPEKEGSVKWQGKKSSIKFNYFSQDPDFRKSSRLRLAERGKWTPIFGIKANLYIQLSCGDQDGVVVRGDYDGDGWYDLAVEDKGVVETVMVYGGIGQRVAEWEVRMKPEYALAGDVDGNGRDEFLCLEGSRIACYAAKQERAEISTWPLGECPSYCADLNGDGTDEIVGVVCELESPAGRNPSAESRKIIVEYLDKLHLLLPTEEEARQQADELTPEELAAKETKTLADMEQLQKEYLTRLAPYTTPHGGILDPATGVFTPLQFPEDAVYPFNMFYAGAGEIACLDINRDGQQEIVAKAKTGTALFIFNMQGELIYQEEFGKSATAMDVVHTKDGGVLVVLVEDGVLAYP